MKRVNLFVANSSGKLDRHLVAIENGYKQAATIVHDRFNLSGLDVIVRADSFYSIPEIGIGGFTTEDGSIIYMSLDVSKKISTESFSCELLHEMSHAARFRKFPPVSRLTDSLISEGLACLLQYEVTGKVPVYARQKISNTDVESAQAELKAPSNTYDHAKWFFGSSDICRWFGYTYGFKQCKQYSAKTGKNASELIFVSAEKVIKS